jgi:hypothetical protein
MGRLVRKEERHLAPEELLLFHDGEMESKLARVADLHLGRCLLCTAALERMKVTLEDVTMMCDLDYRDARSSSQRMRLRLRLGQEAQSGWTGMLAQYARWTMGLRVAMVLLIVASGVYVVRNYPFQIESASAMPRSLPDPRLTPGDAVPVRYADICPAKDADQDPPLPLKVRDTVLHEYGVSGGAMQREFRVDYLISPQLGGTAEIRNLWPQPSRSNAWNASEKDALETKLHSMVCQGEMPLSEAQHEIATDWIASYKKYFRTASTRRSDAFPGGNGWGTNAASSD